MTTEEAIKIINKAIIESENVIAELSKIKALAERKSMVGEYYANIQNSEQEIEACKVAIEALKEIQQYRAIGTVEDFVNLKRGAAIMSDLYKFGYTLYETIKTMRDVIDTGNYDRMFLDTYYWLKMLSEYKEIGTVEECRKAVEKQIAKQCDIDSHLDHIHYKCPSCGQIELSVYKHGFPRLGRITKYCENCGQALIDIENLEGMEDE